MRYMGGKSRIAKELTAVMLAQSPGRSVYVEPFLGGGAVAAHMGQHFEIAQYSDFHEDLMLMWASVLDGWVPPTDVTYEEYQAERYAATPSARRGFVGYGCSFGGRWFEGYARYKETNFAKSSSGVVVKQRQGMTPARDFKAFAASFFDLETPPPGAVAYMDPPYANTKGYSKMGAFDSVRFWVQAQEWAESGVDVYVSEYAAPAGWTAVWEKQVTQQLDPRKDRERPVERLFRWIGEGVGDRGK